ncbi:unnamed protein product [Vitrella brassicaformis CCMP3155]|uniref:Histone RNA hairpin-binding protein RNA-binding domain-containing protein n=1 Tax=Vitrella brassicaformis (strain CCMP3155) TaxID=1169540 RepID=A0A0G4EUB6_VITBC|nr:unnamed protein product [Vitrella brassicaformis CCMP3155]|eukprot:CEM01795.1 unnamed protein product [Vitrella brassicaformis CCMP3155]
MHSHHSGHSYRGGRYFDERERRERHRDADKDLQRGSWRHSRRDGDYQEGPQRIHNPSQRVETDPARLKARRRQIEIGKNTNGYERYRAAVPKDKRDPTKSFSVHPVTPSIHEEASKRGFDGRIRAWRRLLHQWDDDAKPFPSGSPKDSNRPSPAPSPSPPPTPTPPEAHQQQQPAMDDQRSRPAAADRGGKAGVDSFDFERGCRSLREAIGEAWKSRNSLTEVDYPLPMITQVEGSPSTSEMLVLPPPACESSVPIRWVADIPVQPVVFIPVEYRDSSGKSFLTTKRHVKVTDFQKALQDHKQTIDRFHDLMEGPSLLNGYKRLSQHTPTPDDRFTASKRRKLESDEKQRLKEEQEAAALPTTLTVYVSDGLGGGGGGGGRDGGGLTLVSATRGKEGKKQLRRKRF